MLHLQVLQVQGCWKEQSGCVYAVMQMGALQLQGCGEGGGRHGN